MKIWITRDPARSITVGGLERVRVWFAKPIWVESKFFFDLPFGNVDSGFHEEAHFKVFESGRCEREPVSFGNVFGYSDQPDAERAELARFVWSKLCEHFLNANFLEWETLEKEEKVKQQDFFLEIDLSIKLNQT